MNNKTGQSYGFSSSHVWLWELDHKEGGATKNWCFWTVVLKKTLESLLDNKEIKSVNCKGNQPWIFIRRTDAEAEASLLWPPDAKSWLIGKDPDAGKIAGRRRRGWQRMRWLGGTIDSMDMSLSKLIARDNLNSKGSRSCMHHSIINHLKIFIESPFGTRNCCRH